MCCVVQGKKMDVTSWLRCLHFAALAKGGLDFLLLCFMFYEYATYGWGRFPVSSLSLSVLWLDLANAFGSIPHKLVQLTLTKHHVPSRYRDLIADYYSNFRMRVSSGAITSIWHKVEIGIITGCTISATLFPLAMNMLTKSAEPECRGPRTNSGQQQPPIRAFMDDLTVMTDSVPGCRWILKGLEKLVEWARMRFKPA